MVDKYKIHTTIQKWWNWCFEEYHQIHETGTQSCYSRKRNSNFNTSKWKWPSSAIKSWKGEQDFEHFEHENELLKLKNNQKEIKPKKETETQKMSELNAIKIGKLANYIAEQKQIEKERDFVKICQLDNEVD